MTDIYSELHGTRSGQIKCHICKAWHLEESITPERRIGFPDEYTLAFHCPECTNLIYTYTALPDGRVLERTAKSVCIKEARR